MTNRLRAPSLLAVGAVVTVSLSGCLGTLGGVSTVAETAPLSPAATSGLDLALEELVAMPGGPPGVIAVVQVDAKKTVHTAGVANLATGEVPGIADRMRLASVTKAFTGATVLSLVDEGALALEDTIGARLPGLPAAWAGVTLRQLLSHTSGLPDFTLSPGFQEAAGASLSVAPAPQVLLTYVYDEPLNFPPGSEYLYSNSDNVAVGLMIEAVTGAPYTEALQARVLDPLGLESTSLPATAELAEPALHGYDTNPPDAPTDVSSVLAPGWSWSSGGLVSTPDDLNTFIRGYVGGELFDAKTQAEQTDLFIPGGESGPPGPGLNAASLSLFRYSTPCGVVYGHTGNIPGYTQFAVASPDGSRSATITMNLARNQGSTGQDLEVLRALQLAEQAAICTILDGD